MAKIDTNANIYDIDGKLIKPAGDISKMTLEEAKTTVEEYRKKLAELPEGDPKQVVYATYMRNLTQYIMSLYAKMPADLLNKELEAAKARSLDEQVKSAIEELSKDVENDGETTENTTSEVSIESPADTESTTDKESRDAEVVERGNSDIYEERSLSQSDLLVERDVNPSDLNMDETIEL